MQTFTNSKEKGKTPLIPKDAGAVSSGIISKELENALMLAHCVYM